MTDSHAAPAEGVGRNHIVDTLIEERAGPLLRRPLVWALVRTFAFPLLRYRAAVQMADAIRPLDGEGVFDWLAEHLALRTEVHGLEHVPAHGRLVVVANHPTGIADGVAVWDALRGTRRDLVFMANRDAVRVAPRIVSSVIPVEWVESRRTRERTRETLRASIDAFRTDRAVMVFPSGRVAWEGDGVLHERPWLSTAVSLAVKYDAPLLPLHITGRNSALYYRLARWNQPLKDMSLFHELLNKRGYRYRVAIAPPIPPGDLAGEAPAVTAHLQRWVERGLTDGEPFRPLAAGAAPAAGD